MKNLFKTAEIVLVMMGLNVATVFAQPAAVDGNSKSMPRSTNITRTFITPTRIVWTSDNSGKSIQNPEVLLNPGTVQAVLNKEKGFIMKSTATEFPMIILDFGKEIQSGVEIVTSINNEKKIRKVRIRFGESVSETLSNIGENGATNDYSLYG